MAALFLTTTTGHGTVCSTHWSHSRLNITRVNWATASSQFAAVHIYAAEWAWYGRWTGNPPTALLQPEKFADVAALQSGWKDLEREVRAFVHELGPAGMDRRFEYKMFNGQPGSSVFWQMLQHVVNHASYHRGQITTMLRQTGAAPPRSMDLIMFYRERQASTPQGRTA